MKNTLFLLLVFMIIGSSCQTDTKIASFSELYEQFTQKGRIHKFENSALMFGSEKISNTDLMNVLKMDTTQLSKIKADIYRKGAFKLNDENDTTTVFKYAVAKDRQIQEVRFRTFRSGSFIEDKAILQFKPNSKVDYDYYVLDDLIYVIATNEKKEKHYTFYRIFRGNINQISFTPDTLFQKEKPFQVGQFLNKEVVIYNDFKDKEFETTETGKGRLTGKVIGMYGEKEIGFYEIVKLNPNNIFDERMTYVAFSNNEIHFPKSLHFITQSEVDNTEYASREVPPFIATDVFVEIIK